LKAILKESDYIIGNLETPLAGAEAGYTERIVSFNSPDTLVDALLDIGVDAVSTANNHCLDRDMEGLMRTHQVLDANGIAHTGTYPPNYTGDRIHYFKVGDATCALIAYTLGVNYDIHGTDLEGEKKNCVNVLRLCYGGVSLYERRPQYYFDTIHYIEELLGRKMIWEETIKLLISLHLPVPVIDDVVEGQNLDEYFKNIEADYLEARKKADIVLFCPHSGGQFNEKPGAYTKLLLEKSAKLGFDGVFAAHSHTSQRAEFLHGKPCFYSMGNVSMTPGTFYSVSECLPDYGLAAHLYIDEKKVQKVTFSIFKMVEENGEALRVVPVDELQKEWTGEKLQKLISETASVYARVTGREIPAGALCKEYDL
jgi:poly-gamma-glutamate synthesis protein (capsule biosynthesis protein)